MILASIGRIFILGMNGRTGGVTLINGTEHVLAGAAGSTLGAGSGFAGSAGGDSWAATIAERKPAVSNVLVIITIPPAPMLPLSGGDSCRAQLQ